MEYINKCSVLSRRSTAPPSIYVTLAVFYIYGLRYKWYKSLYVKMQVNYLFALFFAVRVPEERII